MDAMELYISAPIVAWLIHTVSPELQNNFILITQGKKTIDRAAWHAKKIRLRTFTEGLRSPWISRDEAAPINQIIISAWSEE